MGKPTGFKEFERKTEPYRDAMERLIDFKEIYTDLIWTLANSNEFIFIK